MTSLLAPDHIRGITIRQPWTACIVHGNKRVENRPRNWAPRWYLLHAGTTIAQTALDDPLVATTIKGHKLHTRAVLGIARITGTHTDRGTPCSPWAQTGRVHLTLDDVHALQHPVPCNGQLGPWRVPLAVYEQVLRQLPHHLTSLIAQAPS